MSAERSRSGGPAQEVIWRRDSDLNFTLLVDGQAAALIDLLDNTAMIMASSGAMNRMAIPDSRSAFDVVEAHLATGRVERWDGHDASDSSERTEAGIGSGIEGRHNLAPFLTSRFRIRTEISLSHPETRSGRDLAAGADGLHCLRPPRRAR